MNHILEKLKIIPNKPGVYLMKNKQQNIIYVGKAKAFRKRLKSYFISTKQHDKRHKN